MANTLFPFGATGIQQKSFQAASAIKFGWPVEISSEGHVQKSDSWIDAIGHAIFDDAYYANHGTTVVVADDLLNVALKGTIMNMVCGTTIAVNTLVTLDSNFQITDIDSGTTIGLAIVGRTLEAGVLQDTIQVMRL